MNKQLHLIGTKLFSTDAITFEISPNSDIDFSKVCRTCLRETKENNLENEALYIIGCNGKLARLFEAFEVATGLKIPTDDMLPRHICNSCLQNVKNSFSFHCQSQRANEILQSVLFSLKDENPSNDEAGEETHLRVEMQEVGDEEEEGKEFREEKIPLENNTEAQEYSECNEQEQEATGILNFDEFYVDENIHSPIDDIVQDDEDGGDDENNENELMMMEIEQLGEVSEQDEISERVVVLKNANKIFPCDFCQSIFNLQRDLIRHYRDEHPDEKPFKCDICSIAFVHIQSMRRHKNTHAACPKQKACPLCNWTFSRSDDLRRHMRTHTDERPYACSVCQKAFKQHTELKDHMLSHEDKKMYKCEPCNKEWRSRNGWYLHMKAHQDGRNGQRKQRVKKFD